MLLATPTRNAAEEDLDTELRRLIAAELGKDPSDITLEFIRNYRAEHIYPHIKIDFTARMGGFNGAGKYLTQSEVDEDRRKADEILERF